MDKLLFFCFLFYINQFICANETLEPIILDESNLNSFDQNSNFSASNLIDIIQTAQLNLSDSNKINFTDYNQNNLQYSIPVLFNNQQYNLPEYLNQNNKNREFLTSQLISSPQTNIFDEMQTNTKDFNYEDSSKQYFEQQIEQDSKLMPDIFDVQQPVQLKMNTNEQKITKPSYSLPTYPTKSPTKKYNSAIRMANNQEWKVIQNDDREKNSAYASANTNYYDSYNSNLLNNINNEKLNYKKNPLSEQTELKDLNQQKINQANQKSELNLNNQNEITKIKTYKVHNVEQPPFRPIEKIQKFTRPVTQQSIVSETPDYLHHIEDDIITKPCQKNIMNNNSKSRPFYFGWKHRLQNQQQKKNVNDFYLSSSYQNPYVINNGLRMQKNYQMNKPKHFGMPNNYNQPNMPRQIKKCCVISVYPKENQQIKYNSYMQNSESTNIPYYNPFQNNLTGMFGVGVGGYFNKIENKKTKLKNLIKAPFNFVNEMKYKALEKPNYYSKGFPENFNNNYMPYLRQLQSPYNY